MIEGSLPLLYGFALVLFRAAGLCVAAPGINARPVPPRVRLGLAFACGFAAFVGAGAPRVAVPDTIWGLASASVTETLIGLVAGYCASAVLQAAMAAGQAAGLGMGLGFGSLIDPSSGAENAVLGQLFAILALAIAMAMGIHREAFAWLAASVRQVPPGGAVDLGGLFTRAVFQSLTAIALSVRIAFPFLAAITFGNLTLGVIGKAAPQLNLANVGFSAALLAGGGALYMLAPYALSTVAMAAMRTYEIR